MATSLAVSKTVKMAETYNSRIEELDDNERQELDLLRLENDTLRRRLEELEGTLEKVEIDTPRRAADPQLEELDKIIGKIKVAKDEAFKYNNVGKNQLAKEVRFLYGLLGKAKGDRSNHIRIIKDLQAQVSEERAAREELVRKATLDREIFAAMIKEDRSAYAARLRDAEANLQAKEKERSEALLWIKDKQDLFLKETHELQQKLSTAKRDAVLQALEYNDVLSREIQDLENEVTTISKAAADDDDKAAAAGNSGRKVAEAKGTEQSDSRNRQSKGGVAN